MSNGMLGNSKATLMFAAIVVALAVVATFAVGTVLPADEKVEQDDAPVAVETPTPAQPADSGWAEDDDDDGWGAAAVAAAANGTGFSSSSSSGSSPFGDYTPDPNQERGSLPVASNGSRRVIRMTRREAAEQLEPRGGGRVAIPMRPRPAQ